jgi:hypothetical protein
MSFDNRTVVALFESCSKAKPGYIDKDEFKVLSKDLNVTPAGYKTLMKEMGFDRTGHISKREFIRAYREACRVAKRTSRSNRGNGVTLDSRGRLDSAKVNATTAWESFLDDMGIEFYLMCRSRYCTRFYQSGIKLSYRTIIDH